MNNTDTYYDIVEPRDRIPPGTQSWNFLGGLIVWFFHIIGSVIGFTIYWINIYFKTLFRLSWDLYVYIVSRYHPMVKYLDSALVRNWKSLCDFLSKFFYNLSIMLYEYGTRKKHYKIKVWAPKYSQQDIARMASWIGEHEKLTLQDIEFRYNIWYDTARKVRDMRWDKLSMLTHLKDSLTNLNTNDETPPEETV